MKMVHALMWMGLICGVALADGPGPSVLLVSDQHHWRKHYLVVKPVIAEDAGTRPAGRGVGNPPISDSLYALFTEPPSADWVRPEFDDGSWMLRTGGEFGRADQVANRNTTPYMRGSDAFFQPVGRICQRSAFYVKDRAKAGAP